MRKLILLMAVCLSTGVIMAQELTLDQILKNHFKAVGQEKIVQLQSVKLSGKASMMGMDIPYTNVSKRPNMSRTEFEIQGMKIIQAYDGTIGWAIIPFSSPDPQDIPADQLKSMKENSDMDGALYNWEAKGKKLELIGKEDINGTAVYNIKMVTSDKDVYNVYIDATSFMIVKLKTKMTVEGNPIESETNFSNYKDVQGIKFAYTTEVPGGAQGVITITMDTIELNAAVDNAEFTKPVKN
jgi:uncharacterized membrane protein YkoI